jgi:hypothetical protein
MPSKPAGADRVRLLGDAWDKDNDVLVIDPEPVVQRIGYLGTSPPEPEKDPAYFLKKAPLDSGLIRRELTPIDGQGLELVLQDEAFSSIILEPVSEVLEHAASLRKFADQGGTVLVSLAQPIGTGQMDAAATAGFLDRLLGVEGIEVTEAEVDDFALIGWVDYRNSVFGPFADPRYNDFSKIRFWSYREVKLPEGEQSAANSLSTLARFDNENPLLVQQRVGRGNIWLLASGWQPAASSLALSSKFVPILLGMLDPQGAFRRSQLSYEIGERVEVEDRIVRVTDASGNDVSEAQAQVQDRSVRFYAPGLYSVEYQDAARQVVVDIPRSESKLTPMDSDVFEQYGVELGKLASDQQRQDSARQMQVEELESKQRLWQWLIAAGIVILAMETLLAGWSAKRVARQLAGA